MYYEYGGGLLDLGGGFGFNPGATWDDPGLEPVGGGGFWNVDAGDLLDWSGSLWGSYWSAQGEEAPGGSFPAPSYAAGSVAGVPVLVLVPILLLVGWLLWRQRVG